MYTPGFIYNFICHNPCTAGLKLSLLSHNAMKINLSNLFVKEKIK